VCECGCVCARMRECVHVCMQVGGWGVGRRVRVCVFERVCVRACVRGCAGMGGCAGVGGCVWVCVGMYVGVGAWFRKCAQVCVRVGVRGR